ncbi:MAG: Asp-tRNA(Asn)/Glu-tRNA(Gln) amidotransferase subunit GatC [Desulfovibrio sp.]|nr:Asp-tRNA(Asn)/Glu-tRNA(Gln) amidotransferase subunit GatC [Desulfovibrio sp.]
MRVSKEQVLATAALCRLDLGTHGETSNGAYLETLAAQLDDVLSYMDILSGVDTRAVQPLYSPLRDPSPPRPDIAEKKCSAAEILANAPERRDNFFVVPAVI